jgi:DNA polymerase III alpha subunit (gram-positive type)
MSDDALKRVNMLRSFHKSNEGGSSSEMVRELKQIKGELKIIVDEGTRKNAPITNATNSPYLQDQDFQKPGVLLGSREETEWKEVKSAEQLKNEILRKINII